MYEHACITIATRADLEVANAAQHKANANEPLVKMRKNCLVAILEAELSK